MEYSNQIVSDKVVEIGAAITLIIIVLQTLAFAFKVKSDHKLIMKILNQENVAEQLAHLIDLSNNQQRTKPLKWCLAFAALSVSFVAIQYSHVLGFPQSDNSSLALIFISLSISFLIYYLMLRSHRK